MAHLSSQTNGPLITFNMKNVTAAKPQSFVHGVLAILTNREGINFMLIVPVFTDTPPTNMII